MTGGRGFGKFRNAPALRADLFLQQDGRCCYCGDSMKAGVRPWEGGASFEHIIERSRGGPGCLDNLALAHGHCNALAAGLSVDEKIGLLGRAGVVDLSPERVRWLEGEGQHEAERRLRQHRRAKRRLAAIQMGIE